jgi:hypothetical protein
MKNETWPEIAIKLARSILRFQKDDYRLHLPDATYERARKTVKKFEEVRKSKGK